LLSVCMPKAWNWALLCSKDCMQLGQPALGMSSVALLQSHWQGAVRSAQRRHVIAAPGEWTSSLQAVEELEALVAQIMKNTQMIERVLQQIARSPLVPSDSSAQPQGSGQSGGSQEGGNGALAGAAGTPAQVPDMHEFYENYEQHRIQVRRQEKREGVTVGTWVVSMCTCEYSSSRVLFARVTITRRPQVPTCSRWIFPMLPCNEATVLSTSLLCPSLDLGGWQFVCRLLRGWCRGTAPSRLCL
jgi:hypothetical protein